MTPTARRLDRLVLVVAGGLPRLDTVSPGSQPERHTIRSRSGRAGLVPQTTQ